MDARKFHNALRIMMNLGQYDLAAAGVIDANWGSADASPRDQIMAFMDDPFHEAVRMPDANFDRLFALIESRQPQPKHVFDATSGDGENCAKCGANWRDTSKHLTMEELTKAEGRS